MRASLISRLVWLVALAVRCLRCLLLVMYTYPFEKKALTLHLARGQGRERYFCCNLMQRKVLASSYQHLMAEAPVLDELHTYRGRQGADVAILVRRLRDRCKAVE